MSGPSTFAALSFDGEAPGYLGLEGPRKQFHLDLDLEVKRCLPLRARGTPEYQKALEAFRRSPLTGCTTVLDLLRLKAGYKPMLPDLNALLRFAHSLYEHPLFAGRTSENAIMEYDSGRQPHDFERHVRNYKGRDEEASRQIEAHVRGLREFAIRNQHSWHKSELLLEHSLGARDVITFYMGRSAAMAFASMDKGRVRVLMKGHTGGYPWEFRAAEWPSHAEAVLQEHLKLVPDWINQT